MDREKVAAGLAVKYEKIVPLLAPTATVVTPGNGAEGTSGVNVGGKAANASGLEFGYNFIEKFIQIPFRVPQPAKLAFESLLDHISPIPAQARQLQAGAPPQPLQRLSSGTQDDGNNTQPANGAGSATTTQVMDGRPTSQIPGENAAAQDEYREKIKLLVTNDSLTVRNIVLMVAPALGYNPRRLKQFINMFRLKALIAAETGLFGVPTLSSGRKSITLQQLGKFVAIGLRWPRLLADLEEDHTLLTVLQGWSVGRPIEIPVSRAHHWTEFAELKALLSYGCDDKELSDPLDPKKPADPRKYSLGDIDVDKLLQVSPRTGSSLNIQN